MVVKASARKVRRLYHDRILAGSAEGRPTRLRCSSASRRSSKSTREICFARPWSSPRTGVRPDAAAPGGDARGGRPRSSLIITARASHRAGAGIDRDRLGRPLRAVGRARAPENTQLDAETVVRRPFDRRDLCIYTNQQSIVETLD